MADEETAPPVLPPLEELPDLVEVQGYVPVTLTIDYRTGELVGVERAEGETHLWSSDWPRADQAAAVGLAALLELEGGT